MKIIELNEMVEVNSDFISFRFEKRLNTISLSECRDNWVKHANSEMDLVDVETGKPGKILENESTCVADRNWFDPNPYFHFYIESGIRFQVTTKRRFIDRFSKSWKQRYYGVFSDFRQRLQCHGWTTFDLG